MWVGGIVIAIVSILIAYRAPKDRPPWPIIHRGIITLWTLGPPIFYLIDAQRRMDANTPPTDMQKYFLDAATKFWAAVSVFLIGIYKSRSLWEPQDR